MRTFLALIVGKLIFKFLRVFKLGGGSAAPGYYALKFDPELVEELAKFIPYHICITGTNGKTTTAKLLHHFFKQTELNIIRNNTGSNLERGIASTLIANLPLFFNQNKYQLGIWEVDEAAFNLLLPKIKPQIIVILNVFRDQLDRYGEVDIVVKRWQDSLQKVDWKAKLVVNGDDGHTASLADYFTGESYFFQVQDHHLAWEQSKTQTKTKPKELISARVVENQGLRGMKLKIYFNKKYYQIFFPIPGIYHVYDLLAALMTFQLLEKDLPSALNSLATFTPAFGRVEKIEINGKQGFIFLIKNPVGATAVFQTLQAEIQSQDVLLLALNDNYADGQDISWIWDAQFELLTTLPEKTKIICSGKRAEELALRLKYAGAQQLTTIEPHLEVALDQAITLSQNRFFILPTYTALLELQKILVKKGVKKHYWREP